MADPVEPRLSENSELRKKRFLNHHSMDARYHQESVCASLAVRALHRLGQGIAIVSESFSFGNPSV